MQSPFQYIILDSKGHEDSEDTNQRRSQKFLRGWGEIFFFEYKIIAIVNNFGHFLQRRG